MKKRIYYPIYSGYCQFCGNLFNTPDKRNRRCGFQCKNNSRKTGSFFECKNCFKKTWRNKSRQIKRGKKVINYFCSVKCTRKYMFGKNHPLYTGKFMDHYGYVHSKNRGIRIASHRHAMEMKIGRKLKPFENVHHVNGIKTDNRIENLELWTRKQPYGQRVSDLIKFVCQNYKKEVSHYLSRH